MSRDVAMHADDASCTVTCTVVNTGDRDGADVVQVYARLPDPDAPRRLVGFRRVEVPTGSSATVEIAIADARFLQRDAAVHAWRPPTGEVELTVARHATDPGTTVVRACGGRPG